MILSPWTQKLRDWQEEAYGRVMTHGRRDFLAETCPGSGKTTFGLRVAHQYLSDGAAVRIVTVCPTDHLRGQWAAAAAHVGIELDPRLSNELGQEARDFHGAVVTYHQVSQAPALFARACRSRPTLVLFDELHHAADGKSWGRALVEAFADAVFRLALSGTCFRSDSSPIPFIVYEDGVSQPDYRYSYAEALRDGVCRPVTFPSYEGELAWRFKGQDYAAAFGDRDVLKIETGARLTLTKARRQQRLKTALLRPDWLSPVLAAAHEELLAVRTRHPDAGGLAIAMNQDHARTVAELVQSVTGVRPPVAISDDPEASATIEAFRRGRQPWLVAVRMVSEGVDIPRLRVGAYLTNYTTDMYFRQAVGRFVRWQPGLSRGQRAYLYLPKDPTLVDYAQAIQTERDHVLRGTPEDETSSPAESAGPRGQTFEALRGKAVADARIFDAPADETPGLALDLPRPEPLHAQRDRLRDTHRDLVSAVARSSGWDHRKINLELIKQTHCRIESATVAQLERRIAILTRWRDLGVGRW